MSDAWRSAGAPDAEGVVRAAERLADRLRVLGPRWSARTRDDDTRLVAQIRAGLQRIADAAARAEGEPRRDVPDLGLHALADQVLVLARDVAATADAGALAEADDVIAGLRAEL